MENANTLPTYTLRQSADGTFAWFAAGPHTGVFVPYAVGAESRGNLPDMQLLGWGPNEIPALLAAAESWLASKGIAARVVVS